MAEWRTCDIERSINEGIRRLTGIGRQPETVHMSPATRCQLIAESPHITCALERGKIVEYIFGLKVEIRKDFEDDKLYIE